MEILDKSHELKKYRNQFYIPQGVIYFDGNSLGLMNKYSEKTLNRVINEWKEMAISGWTKAKKPWFYYGEYLGQLTAPLIGAEENEVVVTNSTTTNIHQLLATFYKPKGIRNKIIVDELNFPSDIYAVKSQMELQGIDVTKNLIRIRSKNGYTLDENEIIKYMSEEVALILLPSVLYQSGQLLNIKRLTEAAHKKEIIIGFDLAHSIGIVPHQLSADHVDFAVWCNYKYLNSGPGATAGLYVNQKHHGIKPALAGWWGHDKATQFNMLHEFKGARDAGAFQIGTVNMLSAAPLEGVLQLYQEVEISKIREVSLQLTQYLFEQIKELKEDGFDIITPLEPNKRGGHIAIIHEEGFRINEALKKRGVIGDFRPPQTIRLAPNPLYNTYEDINKIVNYLKEIILNKEYLLFSKQREAVT